MLIVAFLIGLCGFVFAVVLGLHAPGMLFAGASLGMLGAFLWLRKRR